MNPVTLMTGFYEPRGERIRHQVHEGALMITTEVYNEDTIQEDVSPIDGTIYTATHTKTIINCLQIMIRPPPVVVASSSSK